MEDIWSITKATIKHHIRSVNVSVKEGVKEDGTKFLKWFKAFLERVLDKLEQDNRIDGEYVSNLGFPDDIVLLNECEENQPKIFKELQREFRNSSADEHEESQCLMTNWQDNNEWLKIKHLRA